MEDKKTNTLCFQAMEKQLLFTAVPIQEAHLFGVEMCSQKPKEKDHQFYQANRFYTVTDREYWWRKKPKARRWRKRPG